VADHVGHAAGGRVGREHAVVGQSELDPERRAAEHEQQEDGGGGERDRSPHDTRRHPVPEPVFRPRDGTTAQGE
jgi:hypothetical protein